MHIKYLACNSWPCMVVMFQRPFMRSILLAALFAMPVFMANAQYYDVSANVHSGLFRYKNINAGFLSQVNLGTNIAYTNNPTGEDLGFSWGISGTVQRFTRYHLVYGLEAGYEALQSRQSINRLYGPFPYDYRPATGSSTFTQGFINLFPFIGGHYSLRHIRLTAKFGYEYAIGLGGGRDKGSVVLIAKDSLIQFNKRLTASDENIDFRLRGQLEVRYHQLGLYIGYSHGLFNYYSRSIGASFETYTRYVRVGAGFYFRKMPHKKK